MKSISLKTFTEFRKQKLETESEWKAAGSQLIKNSLFREEEVESWAKFGGAYHRVANARKQLEPGFYVGTTTLSGPILVPLSVSHDDILELPDTKTSEVLAKANAFWELEATFKALGFMHKRGILIDGKPGTGKSVIAFKAGREVVQQHAGVTIFPTDPYSLVGVSKDFRAVQPDTKLLVIAEDIDEWTYSYGEKTLTAYLDGEYKIDNMLFIATTNNKKALSSRLLKRPSRFDVKVTIGVLSKEARRSFLEQKATTLTPEQITLWTESTDGYTVPMLKELMVLVLAYCYPLDNSLDKIRKDFSEMFIDE